MPAGPFVASSVSDYQSNLAPNFMLRGPSPAVALSHDAPLRPLTVTPVFEPCVFETFTAAGLGDWSFASTGGVTNPGSQGNSGGYCRVADGTGTSYALAPARFLGDWSPLLDTGRLTIDVRMVTIGGPIVDVPQFIRLSGPGGVAHVSLQREQQARRAWMRVAAAVNARSSRVRVSSSDRSAHT